METTKLYVTKENLADSILEPALNPPLSIDLKNITVSFPSPKGRGIYTAVKEINFQVKKGEIVSLIGHSGCGKSTLMGTISGMVKPTTAVCLKTALWFQI